MSAVLSDEDRYVIEYDAWRNAIDEGDLEAEWMVHLAEHCPDAVRRLLNGSLSADALRAMRRIWRDETAAKLASNEVYN